MNGRGKCWWESSPAKSWQPARRLARAPWAGYLRRRSLWAAALGYLIGCGFHDLWPHSALTPSAFALVGMGAFLAATTHAPLMAMLMVFEITLDYAIILPLMLGCVIAYYLSIGIEPASIYSDALKRKGARLFDEQLSKLRVLDLMKPGPPVVPVTARVQ